MKVEYKSNLKGLDNLEKAIKNKLETRVGILGSSPNRGESATNADIGLTHEMGVVSKNIPARSWLRMPLEEKAKEISNKVLKNKQVIAAEMAGGDMEKMYEVIGLAAEVAIQEAFESRGFGKWADLSQKTITAKGSDSPLIDTGQLREAVMSQVEKRRG